MTICGAAQLSADEHSTFFFVIIDRIYGSLTGMLAYFLVNLTE